MHPRCLKQYCRGTIKGAFSEISVEDSFFLFSLMSEVCQKGLTKDRETEPIVTQEARAE